jgi:hypothetical protein
VGDNQPFDCRSGHQSAGAPRQIGDKNDLGSISRRFALRDALIRLVTRQ